MQGKRIRSDAADRRTIVLLSEAGLMAGSLLLAGNSLLPHPLIWLIFAIAALQGAFDALQRPSLDALLPRLVDRDELASAGALGSVRGTVGMIAGPALAGVLVAVVGLPDERLGEVPVAFVVGAAPDAELDRLLCQHITGELARQTGRAEAEFLASLEAVAK